MSTKVNKPTESSENNKSGDNADPILSKWAEWESYFFNQGANLAFLTMFISFNIAFICWGTWEFTAPHWVTENDILRVTLPIARAAGRSVTLNIGLVILSGCKYWWTLLRPYCFGFPVDNVMPYFHRIMALTVIVMGCVMHTIPQIVNYASETLVIEHDGEQPVWTFGDEDAGLPTTQLFYTGILLVLVFGAFFFTTLVKVRKTAWGFRIFWWTHVICISLSLPLLIIHGSIRGSPFTIYFLGGPLVLYIIDIFMRRVTYSIRAATVVELVAHQGQGDDDRVTKVVLQSPDFVYHAGQYAELKIPSISTSEWHPFTIASAPNANGEVTFYIKASGRWTNALFDLASTNVMNDTSHSLANVSLRGPFGAPAQNYFSYKHIVVIGSGIGVTPLLSVWQHLVSAAKDYMLLGSMDLDQFDAILYNKQEPMPKNELEEALLKKGNVNNVDVVQLSSLRMETWSGLAAYAASALESMTVNILLFCFSFACETIVFSVWVFEKVEEAAMLQIYLNVFMAGIFGAKIFLSTWAYGCRYLGSFVFKLELSILIMDTVSLWSSIETIIQPRRTMAIIYFSFYAAFILLHACRIFYIFYATAVPPKEDYNTSTSTGQSETQSITGIWVSRTYESMAYASQDLSVQDLPPSFSLQLYATRDKEEVVKKADPFQNTGSNKSHALHAGRPDWEAIMTKAIQKAHYESKDGEGDAVGVFFCGSPAIARTLQRTALQVTANHKYKHEGTCRCRILVHKENF